MTNATLQDKIAVVTGGSRGIGKHFAAALNAAGAKVVITGRHETTLRETSDAIGETCLPIVCDHSQPDSIRAMAKRVISELGAPDILVNNAAFLRGRGRVVDMPLETWNSFIDTNLTGVFLTTQAFLPAMIEQDRGDIYMISSMSGKKGDPGSSAYAASKFGLQGFSQALLYEVRKHNIRVTVLNPSSVDVGPDTGPKEGPGLHLHAADLAATLVHLCALPRRTLVRDMDIWGTNP